MSCEIRSIETTRQWLADLLKRADSGNASELRQVKAMLADPEGKCLVNALGDVAHRAESELVRLMGGPVCQAALQEKLRALREELTGPAPSAAERLLVERVVACWLQVAHADTLATTNDQSIEQAKFNQRRQDRAHRRFLSAVKTLAAVQRLALPIKVDVNLEANVTARLADESNAQRPRCCPPTSATDPNLRTVTGRVRSTTVAGRLG